MSVACRPLFVTGPARSGSTLLAMMLSAHPQVRVAADPCLPLFRSLRDAVVHQRGSETARRLIGDSVPLQDYYFSDDRLAAMDAVLGGSLDTPLASQEWQRLLPRAVARATHASPDIAALLPSLQAATYRELFDHILRAIADARNANGDGWVGLKDLWVIDLFESFARAYPAARFIVILRDPRAIVASMLALERTDADQVAHVLSYARHWRKHIAFIERYQRWLGLQDRVHVVKHETLVADPERTATALCRFLEVPFDARMLDAETYFDHATGETWRGNSSFETTTRVIEPAARERWRSGLDPAVRSLIELVCWPDMHLAGYERDGAAAADEDTRALAYLLRSNASPASWRSDFGDPQRDFGYELFRRALLHTPDRPADGALVRRSFLFEHVFETLRAQCLDHDHRL